MQFTIGTLSRCAGGNHYQVPVTVGAITKTLHLTKEELDSLAPDDAEQAKEFVLQRIRSAILEANATTLNQIRTALENKTFKV